MSDNEILVTDSLFVHDRHERSLEQAGFVVRRLDRPQATEEELTAGIVGVQGYILGGVEKVTEPVLAAADRLKAIVFTGSGYTEFIPAHVAATRRGIAIANAPTGVTDAVAEYTLGLMLLMTRQVLELGRTGDMPFSTTTSIRDSQIGVVGLGRIGARTAALLRGIGVEHIRYSSRRRKIELETAMGLQYCDLEELLSTSDIVTIHVSKEAGDHYIGRRELALLPDGALLINASFAEAVDPAALFNELESRRIRAAFDAPPAMQAFAGLPLRAWFASNAQTAYNTVDAVKRVSDMVTLSMINLLLSGSDQYLVNPEYRLYL